MGRTVATKCIINGVVQCKFVVYLFKSRFGVLGQRRARIPATAYAKTLACIFPDDKYNMKQTGQIILPLIILTLGCQPTKKQENAITTDTTPPNAIETLDKSQEKVETDNVTENIDDPKDFDKFEMRFEHEDKEQNFKQRLGITWLTDNSIEFRLMTDDDICGTDYWGSAKDNNVNMDPEMDEDENGDTYAASEYSIEQETYSLRIRISLDKDKARIIYTHKTEEETDCIPQPNLLLVNENAR